MEIATSANVKHNEALNAIRRVPDKTQYKNTTTHRFKQDLVNFFLPLELHSCLEIGTNHGHTAYVMSYVFEKVYSVDHKIENLFKANEICEARENIQLTHGNAYDDATYKTIPDIDVAIIDCSHIYDNIIQDVGRCVNYFDKKESGTGYMVFDDYGHPTATDVKKAVNFLLANLKGLSLVQFIGETKGYKFNESTTLVDAEGVILKYVKP